jgi:hypothetical protein
VFPVVMACIALECPINRGKKNDEQASIMSPLRANTKPILALLYAMRMFIGNVIVIPIPTAEPCSAPIVGFRHWDMDSATFPPLLSYISSPLHIYTILTSTPVYTK